MIGGPIDPTRQAFDRGRDLIAESRAQQRVREIFAEHEAAYARTGDPLAQPPPPLGEVEGLARQLGRPEFLRQVPPQPILQNFALSIWEFVHGQTVLTSRPWNLSLPVADLCNARCTFCTSWLDGRKLLDLDDLDRFESVLGTALQVGLTGHGEPLAHPQFDELCDRLTAICDPRAILYTITNGYFLSKWRDQLDRSNLRSYSISLNAATAETHDAVMGLGPDAFPRIIEAISGLVELGRRPGRSRTIWISMVVTRQNLAEIPAFVELGNRLGITTIRLGTLLPQAGLLPGLNYHLLPPYLHPEFDRLRQSAVAAIRDSQIPVVAEPRSWEQRVLPEVIERQIAADPPGIVPRELALRDRDLRLRNAFLYDQQKGVFRGQPLDDATGVTSIRWSEKRLHVVTPKGPGAYAAGVRVDSPAAAPRRLRVAVAASCEAGELGFGLLDYDKNAWLERAGLRPGSAGTVVLDTSVEGQRIDLMIVNNASDGIPARGSVGEVTVSADGEPPRPIDWGTLTIHNSPDPLDDGSNPLGRQPRLACKAVYYNFYVNEMFYRMAPCCYMTRVPGFEELRLDGDMTFDEAWNSPGMVALRRRLADGPLYGACLRCSEKW